MQYSTLFVITFSALLYSCRSKTNQIIPAKEDTTVTAKVEDTIIPHYTFDTSKSMPQNIRLGWIDTFSIEGRHFRLYQDSNQALKIDAFTNRWINNITIGDYFWGVRLEDIDKDGFTDFSYSHRRHGDTYFYNRNKKLFNTNAWHVDGSQTLLDSNKLTYYSYFADDIQPIQSTLYSFKFTRRSFHYAIYYTRYENSFKGFIGLWKYRPGADCYSQAVLVKKLKVCRFEEAVDFDYETYWKKHYRTLLNN